MTNPARPSNPAIGLALLLVAIAAIPGISHGQDADGVVTSDIPADACPFDLLAHAYGNLADDTPVVLDVYAIEKEILLLCRERQELLLTIAVNEANLRKIMDLNKPAPLERTFVDSPGECIQPDDPSTETGEAIAVPLPEPVVSPVPQDSEPHPEESDVAIMTTGITPSCPPPDSYELNSIIRTGPNWQARLLTRDGDLIRVRLLDHLPDGRRVTGIDRLSLTITDAGGESSRLTFSAARDKPDAGHSRDGESTAPMPDRESGMDFPGHQDPADSDFADSDGTLDVIQPQDHGGRP